MSGAWRDRYARSSGVATLLLVFVVFVAAAGGCGDVGWGDNSNVGADGGWSNQNNASPTGTYLSPRERDGLGYGYEVLDEACEDVLDPDYLARFETPMFRGVAHYGGVAHLVDGSLVWSVRVTDPARPERLSLKRLDGHPLEIAADPSGHLFVAAGEAGLQVLQARDATAMAASLDVGDASGVAPRWVSRVALPQPALDVETLDGSRFVVVAAGTAGLVVVDASDLAAPVVAAQVTLPGFANAVAVDGQVAWVAACRTLAGVDVSDPLHPVVLDVYGVPYGHARGVAAAHGQVFIAGGEALFTYDATDPQAVVWTGYYAEPQVDGFYVNDVVERRGILYLAAGDESVRSVDTRDLSAALGFPAEKYTAQAPPGLEPATSLPPADEQPQQGVPTLESEPRDPIAVGLIDDLLLVLGNFRWMGERTLVTMRVDDAGTMTAVGSYVQPNELLGLDVVGDYAVLHRGTGNDRAVHTRDGTGIELPLGAPARRTLMVQDRLWVLTEQGRLLVWNPGDPELSEPWPSVRAFDVAVSEDGACTYVSDRTTNQLLQLRLDTAPGVRPLVTPEVVFPGFAYLVALDRYLYAYEWVTGVLHVVPGPGAPSGEVSPARIGQCEMYDIADFFSGRKENRTRLRLDGDQLHVLCPHTEQGASTVIQVDLSAPRAPARVDEVLLPEGRYVDLAVTPEAQLLLTFDNRRYLSTLVRVVGGQVDAEASFYGHANTVRVVGSLTWVADGDAGPRLFRVTATGDLEYLGLGVLP